MKLTSAITTIVRRILLNIMLGICRLGLEEGMCRLGLAWKKNRRSGPKNIAEETKVDMEWLCKVTELLIQGLTTSTEANSTSMDHSNLKPPPIIKTRKSAAHTHPTTNPPALPKHYKHKTRNKMTFFSTLAMLTSPP